MIDAGPAVPETTRAVLLANVLQYAVYSVPIHGQCDDHVDYDRNVQPSLYANGEVCGSNFLTTDPGFVSPDDLPPRPDSPAIDLADPTDFPAVDADGAARGNDGAPEAGAYEAG